MSSTWYLSVMLTSWSGSVCGICLRCLEVGSNQVARYTHGCPTNEKVPLSGRLRCLPLLTLLGSGDYLVLAWVILNVHLSALIFGLQVGNLHTCTGSVDNQSSWDEATVTL
ncbi:hypothetical protein COO60DRAFT_1544540 [Scenedesmus sp. NREL 46B-D3]|nr:hypothetical protein COO60DRAFT_1544540 [Scenedesmus sp. NREL 46B-D3]